MSIDMTTTEPLQIYQVPHVDGVFRLYPPLREGEHPLQVPGGISVYRHNIQGKYLWQCGQCRRKASATIPCPHIRQVQSLGYHPLSSHPAGARVFKGDAMSEKDVLLPLISVKSAEGNKSLDYVIEEVIAAQRDADWEKVQLLVKALRAIQEWLLDTEILKDDGIYNSLFVKANNMVKKALAT